MVWSRVYPENFTANNSVHSLFTQSVSACFHIISPVTLFIFLRRNVLVYKLGGSTLNVSILNVNNGIFRLLATETDRTCGGDQQTSLLVENCAKDFQRFVYEVYKIFVYFQK